ncbi:MAG: DUF1761 domain-containing protein [Candidatus Moraniibacteriota bacterium]
MEINYWAVVTSAIVSMVIGSIWYGPLFGKRFMEATGMNEWSKEKQAASKRAMPKAYLGQFGASLVMFFVFAWYIGLSGHPGALGGINNAFWVWIGFVVPLALGNALWGGKMTVFWLNIGNMLATLLAAGAIIGAWR